MPVLVAGSRSEAAKLGGSGTLPTAMDGIFDQAGALVVVVRVAEGADEAETISHVIGGVNEENGAYEGVHRERQIGIAKQLFKVMNIERHDQEARQGWVLRGFRQFDAPVSIVVTYDRSIHGGDIAPFDCGGVTNALVTAAWSRGLGCVINSQGIMQSPVVREHANIPDDQVIMICVAMGYPDDTFPANAVVSERKSVDEAATFVGFED